MEFITIIYNYRDEDSYDEDDCRYKYEGNEWRQEGWVTTGKCGVYVLVKRTYTITELIDEYNIEGDCEEIPIIEKGYIESIECPVTFKKFYYVTVLERYYNNKKVLDNPDEYEQLYQDSLYIPFPEGYNSLDAADMVDITDIF